MCVWVLMSVVSLLIIDSFCCVRFLVNLVVSFLLVGLGVWLFIIVMLGCYSCVG